MKNRKLAALFLALVMVLSMGLAAHAQDVTELPRNETLYFGGQQWGTVNSWNPVGANQNNAMATTANAQGSRTIMFETLYMYNFMDGSMKPLLAEGEPVWNDALTEVTVKINPAAKWSDGTPVTANDVVKTWEIDIATGNTAAVAYQGYIDAIEAADDATVVIKAKLTEDGKPVNPLLLKDFLTGVFIAQKGWLETLETRCGGDGVAMANDPTTTGARTPPCGASCRCPSTSRTASTPTTPRWKSPLRRAKST